PDVGVNAIQGIVFAAEAIMHVGSAHQAAVKSVGPAVIATLDPPGEMSFSAGADAGAAMAAHVEKGSQRATRVASDNDAFIRDLAEKIVARLRNLVDAPGANPTLTVEAFELGAEEIGICVVAGR